MQNNSQIEELFKVNLSGAEVTPSNSAWGDIDAQLSDKEMSALFQSKLANNTIQPSTTTWNGIASQLPKASFWQSSMSTAIYSASAIVALLIGILFVISPFSNQKDIKTENTNKTVIAAANHSNMTQVASTTKPILDNTNKSVNSNITKQESINSGNNYTNNKIGNKPSNKKNSFVAFDKKDKEEKKEENKKSTKTSTNKPVIANQNLILNNNNNNNNNTSPESSKIISYIDTLVVYDTIKYYDTLIVKNTKPKTFKTALGTSLWSITPHVTAFGSNPNHISSTSETESLFNKTYTNELSYSFGLSANYDINNWRISSGLDYTIIQEEFNYETQKTETNPVKKYTLNESGFYSDIYKNITYTYEYREGFTYDTVYTDYTVIKYEYNNYSVLDTVWRYKIDSVFEQGTDTIMHVRYDTVRVATYDTSYYNSIDTTIYTTYYQNINKYTYIEIPLSIGYAFNIKRFSIRPTVGALFGIMLNAKGKGISMTNKNEVYNLSDMDLPFMNVQISMFVGIGLEYKIQDNLALSFQPFYRRNLNSIYSEESVLDKRFSGLGATFGLSFYIN